MRFLLLLLLFVTTAHAKRLTEAELDKITQADINRTKTHKGSLLGKLQTRADAAEEFEQQTRDRLTFTQEKLIIAESSARALEKHDAEQTALAITEKARGDKFEHGYNKVTWPLAIAVALFVFSSLMHLTDVPLIGKFFAQYRLYLAGALAFAALFAVHALIGRYAFS